MTDVAGTSRGLPDLSGMPLEDPLGATYVGNPPGGLLLGTLDVNLRASYPPFRTWNVKGGVTCGLGLPLGTRVGVLVANGRTAGGAPVS